MELFVGAFRVICSILSRGNFIESYADFMDWILIIMDWGWVSGAPQSPHNHPSHTKPNIQLFLVLLYFK
jgi:hypothetical protein